MHIFGGVEGDYRRGDTFKKRRALMDAWAVSRPSWKPNRNERRARR